MRHVNVIRNWRVVELGHLLRVAVCQMLVGYSHVFVCVCVCVCVAAQLHAFIPTVMHILCRLVCAWVHVLELHISALPNYLLRQGSCLPLSLSVGCHSMHE